MRTDGGTAWLHETPEPEFSWWSESLAAAPDDDGMGDE